MILILSQSTLEPSTEDVIDWLVYGDKPYTRINGDEFLKIIKGFCLSTLIEELPIDKINICWFRRWNDEISLKFLDESNISNINSIVLYNYLTNEVEAMSDIFWHHLKEKKWLTNPKEAKQNKLQVLMAAKENGIEIPDTIITTSKEELVSFKNKYKRIISKSITDMVKISNDGDVYDSLTTPINEDTVEKLNPHFFPSLFQELIEKEYEIRSFFLDRKFYSMAIFSQLDKKTEIDFRNYNSRNPNRTVPYKLPEDLEIQLMALMDNLRISNGSLDIIKTKNGRYVLLECNPVGQFGMTSFPCNYYLEQKIAKHLHDNDN